MNIRELITELEKVAAKEGDELPVYGNYASDEVDGPMYDEPELKIDDKPGRGPDFKPLPRGLIL